MRKNAQEQDFYKNVPLANDTLTLLEELESTDKASPDLGLRAFVWDIIAKY